MADSSHEVVRYLCHDIGNLSALQLPTVGTGGTLATTLHLGPAFLGIDCVHHICVACLEKDLSEKKTRSNRPMPVLIAVCDQNDLIKDLVNAVLDGQLFGSGCCNECLVSGNSLSSHLDGNQHDPLPDCAGPDQDP